MGLDIMGPNFWNRPTVTSKNKINFVMFFTLRGSRGYRISFVAKDSQSRFYQRHPWTPWISPLSRDLRSSILDFCNVGVAVDDIGARRMSAAENLQREDLTVFEIIESIVEMVNAEMIGDKEYGSMGKIPVDRVKALLGKLDSIVTIKIRGSKVSKEAESLLRKFAQQVEKIFKNLPKPLEWRSFYRHELPILMDICEEVQKVSIQHNLNKSQAKALAKLNSTSKNEFQRIVNRQSSSANQPSANRALSDFSATEIEAIAGREIQKEILAEKGRSRIMPSFSSEVKILLLDRLGAPAEKIAERRTHAWPVRLTPLGRRAGVQPDVLEF